eukprot:scaffold2751_cov131-Cylindrotheca_fusiformis.AAC.25
MLLHNLRPTHAAAPALMVYSMAGTKKWTYPSLRWMEVLAVGQMKSAQCDMPMLNETFGCPQNSIDST